MKKLLLILAFLLIFPFNLDAAQRLEPLATFFTNSGSVASSYLLYTYAPGTTTAKATYKEATLTNQHPNPIVLNYAGRPTLDYPIYFQGAIKFVLKTAGGGLVYSVDNYTGPSNITTYFYLSDYAHMNDLDDAANAYSGGACAAVLNKADTMDANASFDSDVTVIGIPGNAITTTGYTLTFGGTVEGCPGMIAGTGTVNFDGPVLAAEDMFSGAATIDIDGDFQAGYYQVWPTTSTVTWSANQPEIKWAWWYAGSGSPHTAIDNAVISLAGNGGTVWTGAGSWTFTSGVTWDTTTEGDGVRLLGQGKYVSTFNTASAIDIITFNAPANWVGDTNTWESIEIANIGFTSDGTGNTAIVLDGIRDSEVHDCYFNGFDTTFVKAGGDADATNTGRNRTSNIRCYNNWFGGNNATLKEIDIQCASAWFIEKNIFSGPTTPPTHGVYATNCGNMHIKENTFACDGTTANIQFEITTAYDSNNGNPLRGLYIIENQFEDAGSNAEDDIRINNSFDIFDGVNIHENNFTSREADIEITPAAGANIYSLSMRDNVIRLGEGAGTGSINIGDLVLFSHIGKNSWLDDEDHRITHSRVQNGLTFWNDKSVGLTYYVQDLVQNQTNTKITLGVADITSHRAHYNGYIKTATGFITAVPDGANTLVVNVDVATSDTALFTFTNGGALSMTKNFEVNECKFSSANAISVEYTTDAAYAPNGSTDLVVVLELVYQRVTNE